MTHEFGGDKLRRRRMMREYVEHLQPIVETAAGRNLVTQDGLLAVIVSAHVEEESSCWSNCRSARGLAARQRVDSSGAATRLKDGPTGKATCHFLHVFLCVAAIDAKRVQLHQLARVVFIYATPRLRRRLDHHLRAASTGVRTRALKV